MARSMEVFGFAHVGLAAPTTLLLPFLGHPRPRPRPRRADHLAQWDHFRCPTGSYRGRPRRRPHAAVAAPPAAGVRARAAAVGARRVAVARQRNSSAFHARVRRVAGGALPAPPRCAQPALLPDHAERQLAAREPRVRPPRLRVPPGGRWRARRSPPSSTANVGRPPRREAAADEQPPPPTKRAVVAPTREPIGRFVASVFEVLARLLSRVSPSGEQMPDHMYAEPGGPFSATVLSATTRWYAPLQKLVALQNASDGRRRRRRPPAAGGAANALAAVVAGFVEDIERCVAYSAAEHLASQLYSSRRATPSARTSTSSCASTTSPPTSSASAA